MRKGWEKMIKRDRDTMMRMKQEMLEEVKSMKEDEIKRRERERGGRGRCGGQG